MRGQSPRRDDKRAARPGSRLAIRVRHRLELVGLILPACLLRKSVKVDQARVVKTDINASNGVIHVIDSVILPDGRK